MTNILILAFQLLMQVPTNNFAIYSDYPPYYMVSETTRFACYTGVLTFDGPPGIYEIWWSSDADSFSTDPVPNRSPVRINDRVRHEAAGPQTIHMPVQANWRGFFRVKLVYRL